MSTFLRFAAQTLILLGFWLLISGQYNALFVAMGLASAALVTWATGDLVAASLGPPGRGVADLPRRAARSAWYLLWLLGQIPPAGLQIAYYILHPRMPIEPGVLRFRTDLRSQVARTLLANSITLVPGTLTLDVRGDELVVHAFVPGSAQDLIEGRMQRRIARVFLQQERDDVAARWETPAEEQEVAR